MVTAGKQILCEAPEGRHYETRSLIIKFNHNAILTGFKNRWHLFLTYHNIAPTGRNDFLLPTTIMSSLRDENFMLVILLP